MVTTSHQRLVWAPACTGKGAVFLAAYRALDAVFKAHGYKVRAGDTGAYNCRRITGGTGFSLHAYGPGDAFTFWTGVTIKTSLAVDVNWTTNPYGPVLKTDMPRSMVNDVLRIRTRNGVQVWRWGGDYPAGSNKDAMHYEIVCDPSDLATGIDLSTLPALPAQPSEDDMTPDQAKMLTDLAHDVAEIKRQVTVSDPGSATTKRTLRHICAAVLNKV